MSRVGDDIEFRTGYCTVCGKHIGKPYNHEKCSLKKVLRRTKKRHKAAKTLSHKKSDAMADYYRDK